MLALLILLGQLPASAPAVSSDRVVPLAIDASDPRLEGHGGFERVEFMSESAGVLHLWTTQDDSLDLLLRIESSDGDTLAEDDDSGGGSTPFLAIEVAPGDRFFVVTGAARDGAFGRFELHFALGSETADTRAAADASRSTGAEIARLRDANDLAGARALARERIDRLASVAGAESSDYVTDELSDAAFDALALSLPGDAARAWQLRLRYLEHVVPNEHPTLLNQLSNLAEALQQTGDLESARSLELRALDALTRTRAEDDEDLWIARTNLVAISMQLGDTKAARELSYRVLEVGARMFAPDAPELQTARMNHGLILLTAGELGSARATFEQVVAAFARTLPDEHPDLQRARQNLVVTLVPLGDLAAARSLEERVLSIWTRTLPDDHPDLQRARVNLAGILDSLGDLAGARALEEQALAVLSRRLPDDHPDLQKARSHLAATMAALGDSAAARALQERVLEANVRTLPADHPSIQSARLALAGTLRRMRDLAGARALGEEALAARTRVLPGTSPELQWARLDLAATLAASGDRAGARALVEQALATFVQTLPEDHPSTQDARRTLAAILAHEAVTEPDRSAKERARQRCAELIAAACRSQTRAAQDAIAASSPREAEERCIRLARPIADALTFALGFGDLGPSPELAADAFALSEVTRGAAGAAAGLLRRAASTPESRALREALHASSCELAALTRKGTTNEEFDRARAKRDAIGRELAALAAGSAGGAHGLGVDVDSVSMRLGEKDAAVAFRRYTKLSNGTAGSESIESFCAFVIRNAGAADAPRKPRLTLVDLGALDAIEAEIETRRAEIARGTVRGARIAAGTAVGTSTTQKLRELVFDPLLPALGDATRVIVVPDDVLNVVPLDALPLDGGAEFVGDRWRIETRATLTELQDATPARGDGPLVAIGGASFDPPAPDRAAGESPPPRTSDILNGSSWEHGFAPLPGTADEVRGVGALYREAFGDAREAHVLEGEAATRDALADLGPSARFLHIATHGWYAPDSIRSWSDATPIDERTGLGVRASGEQQVSGTSPMLLCGLALAGANLPEDAVGRAPGLVTAEEIAALDLSNCELAVLSACDTNVGVRRFGQGVASLQRALQMAGARSVITSLWEVPDEATKELMLDFYRRLWIAKEPKAQALWEAKKHLRDARDSAGRPIYTVRDWAAWVLTGDPD